MKSLIKMGSRSLLLGVTLAFAPVFADTLSVTVTCSNGQVVSNLPVTVVDSNGQMIPDVEPTNSKGIFMIDNSEMYTLPLFMYFTSPQGYECGSYYIYIDPQGLGQVSLNYYPTELPCSCSQLLEFYSN